MERSFREFGSGCGFDIVLLSLPTIKSMRAIGSTVCSKNPKIELFEMPTT